MDTVIYIFVMALASLSGILALLSPVFIIASVIDLAGKGRSKLPILFHVTAFFSAFTFAVALDSILDGPEVPLLVKVPAAVGLVLMWICAIRVAMTKCWSNA